MANRTGVGEEQGSMMAILPNGLIRIHDLHNELTLEQGPTATEEAASLADRQFWWRGDKIELRHRSIFLAAKQSWKP